VTEKIRAAIWKAVTVSGQLYISLIRTCVLNLIAQIAIGTPIGAKIRSEWLPVLFMATVSRRSRCKNRRLDVVTTASCNLKSLLETGSVVLQGPFPIKGALSGRGERLEY
jgi:hypothetical protein